MEQADIMIQARRAEAMKANSVNSKVIRGAREALAALMRRNKKEKERGRRFGGKLRRRLDPRRRMICYGSLTMSGSRLSTASWAYSLPL